jgi:hypothetical protein
MAMISDEITRIFGYPPSDIEGEDDSLDADPVGVVEGDFGDLCAVAEIATACDAASPPSWTRTAGRAKPMSTRWTSRGHFQRRRHLSQQSKALAEGKQKPFDGLEPSTPLPTIARFAALVRLPAVAVRCDTPLLHKCSTLVLCDLAV